MKIYFDENMKFIPIDNEWIIYNPHTHFLIKVCKNTKNIIDNILENGSGNTIKLNSYEMNVEKIIDILLKYKFLFYTYEEYMSYSFDKKTLEIKEKIKFDVAYLHLTQKCNLACSYCYNKKNLNSINDLPTIEWIKIIDKLIAANFKTLVFTGGECLLRNDIEEIVSYAVNKSLKVNILTNGTLLENHTQLLYLANKIIISLDALESDTNNITRKNSNQYDLLKILNNIDDKFKKKIFIRSVITNKNKDKVHEMKNIIKNQFGMNYINTIFIPNNKSEIKLVPEIDCFKSELICENKFSSRIIGCGACQKEIAINANGDIYPCQSLIKPEFFITNIFNPYWEKEVLDSKISRKFKKTSVMNINKCNKCPIRFLCGGGCRAIAYNIYGDIDAHIDYFCKYLEKDAIERIKSIKFNKIECEV